MDFVNEHYTKSILVLDGYKSGPSTKDITHMLRSKGKNIAREALESAKSKTTLVIGEDTNILVLLAFFVNPRGLDLIFTSDKVGKGTQRWTMVLRCNHNLLRRAKRGDHASPNLLTNLFMFQL